MDVGKHVYVQKPLCWSVHEARHARDRRRSEPRSSRRWATRDTRPTAPARATSTSLRGAIGEIREVHVWTNRPLGYWPQGIPRPAPLPPADPERPLRWNGPGVDARLAAAMVGDYPVPDRLTGISFLGVAPQVEYHPIYHPFNWRGWVDWGQGALGDMGAHLIDHPFWSLNLGMPTVDRNDLDAVQRRDLSARHDDVLRVRGARQHAGRSS